MDGRIENELKIINRVENIIEYVPEYVVSWYYNLKANKMTASTCYVYLLKVKQFIDFINGKNTLIEDITPEIIDKYFNNIQYKNGKPTTDSYYNCTRECLLNFFDFLVKRNYMNSNIIKENTKSHKNNDLSRINQKRVLLSEEDFINILSIIKSDIKYKNKYAIRDMIKIRDYAIMMLFMNTGIRRQALVNINVQDIDLSKNELIEIDKGGVTHKYKIKDNLKNALIEWLYYREKILCNISIKTDALFISYRGKRIVAKNICDLTKKYSKKALGFEISPHKLRSGCVSILYNKTGDIEFCRRFIGHKNISTTQRYIITNEREKEEGSIILDNIF